MGESEGGGAPCSMSLCSADNYLESCIFSSQSPSLLNFNTFPLSLHVEPHIVNSRRVVLNDKVISIYPAPKAWSLEFS